MIDNIFKMTKEENIFCAKRVMVDSIYQQANLEGIAVTFAQTQDILNDVNVNELTPNEISKVFCLRDGWKFLLDTLDKPLSLAYVEELHEIIARFDVEYQYLGKLRTADVMISGTRWRPEIPNDEILDALDKDFQYINNQMREEETTDIAIEIGLKLMRLQLFKDGNKRIGSFILNKVLIENGRGIFNVPVEYDGLFKSELVRYYESENTEKLKSLIVEKCLDGTTKIDFK